MSGYHNSGSLRNDIGEKDNSNVKSIDHYDAQPTTNSGTKGYKPEELEQEEEDVAKQLSLDM